MRTVLTIAAAAAVIAAAAFFLLRPDTDSIVAGVIEREFGAVTQTQVGVSGIDLSLRDGRGRIERITVANPEGFRAPDAIVIGHVTAGIDHGGIGADPVVIDDVRIGSVTIHAEFAETGWLNLYVLRQNLDEYGRSTRTAYKAVKKPGRFRITRFVVGGGRIEVDPTVLGLERRTLTFPELEFPEIGGYRGESPDGIAKYVLYQLTFEAIRAIARSGMWESLDAALEGREDQSRTLLKNLHE